MSFRNPVVAGSNGELTRASVQSPDYVPGVSGWSINRDGSAEFNNISIRINADVGDVITIGPDTQPQVIISANPFSSVIQFPTNSPDETSAAMIDANVDTSNESVKLRLWSGTTDAFEVENSAIELSSSTPDQMTPSQLLLRGDGFNSEMRLGDGIEIFGETEFTDNIVIGRSAVGFNSPCRVVGGAVAPPSPSNTTIGGTDTLINDTDLTGINLESGVVYSVEIQISVLSTGGASPAGENRLNWKLWDGSVGGTQLGSDTRNPKISADSGVEEDMWIRFFFEYTGTGGLKTLSLSCARDVGTDTIRAIMNGMYSATVTRMGRPGVINNL